MYNKVFLIGNLTRDPELRYTPSGIPVCRFTIAVNRPPQKGAEGTQNAADFFNLVAWRRLAEICGEFLKKGRPICAEGRLQIRQYEKDGQKQTISEVILDGMQMLGRRPDDSVASGKNLSEAKETTPLAESVLTSDPLTDPVSPSEGSEEIPF